MQPSIPNVSCGIHSFPAASDEYKQQPLDLNDLIDNKSASFIARASGNCMKFAGIEHNDLLLIDRSLKPQQNDVIVATLDGVLICKFIDLENRLLVAADGISPPIYIDGDTNFTLEGVVIRSIRCHRPFKL